MSFVHLHIHSEYSILESTARIKDLVAKAKQEKMPALAITDSANLYGAMEFYKECELAGIKPIIGCELRIAHYDTNKQEQKCPQKWDFSPIVLLAINPKGYSNLCQLITEAKCEALELFDLQDHAEGLICLSGGDTGEISGLVLRNKLSEAKQAAEQYKRLFDSNFYLEVTGNNPEIISGIKNIAEELDIKIVAAANAYSCEPEDELVFNSLRVWLFDKNQTKQWLKTVKEMKTVFRKNPEYLTNTLEIADKIDFHFKHKNYMPIISKYPDKELDILINKNIGNYYKDNQLIKAKKQAAYELNIIKKLGTALYLLIVHDYVWWAKANNIPKGPGRGATAGSIINYILGITDVDPLKYNLIFERFINRERNSLPDIDIDFCDNRRKEVIEYLFNKYGQDKTAFVTTIGTIGAKYAIYRAAKVLNISDKEISIINNQLHQDEYYEHSINYCINTNKKAFKKYNNDVRYKQLIDNAKKIEGLPLTIDQYCPGIAIASIPLKNITPINGNLAKEAGQTQFTCYDLESLGVLKLDILGLRILTIIEQCEKYIRQNPYEFFDLEITPFNDKKTLELFKKGQTIGCFQLDSIAIRTLLKDIKPENMEDITAVLALFRPGPLEAGIVDQYIAHKQGRKKYKIPFPELKPYLDETYGIIIYQEQLMQIANTIGGFSMAKADKLRRTMGKGKTKEVAEFKNEFLQGAIQRGFNKRKAGKLFEQCYKYAPYCFSKAHAVSYALIAYRTAYLKANFPVEYMAAIIEVIRYLSPEIQQECKRMGIALNGCCVDLLENFTAVDTCMTIKPQGKTIYIEYEL